MPPRILGDQVSPAMNDLPKFDPIAVADEIARLHDLSQRIAGGEDPDFILIAVAGELRELLSLKDCRFVREQPSGKGAWIAADGAVHLNPLRWPAGSVGLPTQHVELPVDVHSDPHTRHTDQPREVHGGRGVG